jgi:hypothetical protein
MADHFGIGRRFFECGDEELGGFHGTTWMFLNDCKHTSFLDAAELLCIMNEV